MDGNNRWRKSKKFNEFDGYKKGADKLLKITEYIFKTYNTSHVSAFALSANNLKRSKSHISSLISVLDYFLDNNKFQNLNFNINFYGNVNFLNKKLISKIYNLANQKKNFKYNLNIFINYGGQEDIIQALNRMIEYKEKFNKSNLEKYLYTKNLPNPDLIIRTGGFQRLSNFFLFQAAFSEIFFLKKLWPDITPLDVNKIINTYSKIDRKFGL
jgi:undecaprenyl diphosphate synthase